MKQQEYAKFDEDREIEEMFRNSISKKRQWSDVIPIEDHPNLHRSSDLYEESVKEINTKYLGQFTKKDEKKEEKMIVRRRSISNVLKERVKIDSALKNSQKYFLEKEDEKKRLVYEYHLEIRNRLDKLKEEKEKVKQLDKNKKGNKLASESTLETLKKKVNLFLASTSGNQMEHQLKKPGMLQSSYFNFNEGSRRKKVELFSEPASIDENKEMNAQLYDSYYNIFKETLKQSKSTCNMRVADRTSKFSFLAESQCQLQNRHKDKNFANQDSEEYKTSQKNTNFTFSENLKSLKNCKNKCNSSMTQMTYKNGLMDTCSFMQDFAHARKKSIKKNDEETEFETLNRLRKAEDSKIEKKYKVFHKSQKLSFNKKEGKIDYIDELEEDKQRMVEGTLIVEKMPPEYLLINKDILLKKFKFDADKAVEFKTEDYEKEKLKQKHSQSVRNFKQETSFKMVENLLDYNQFMKKKISYKLGLNDC